VHSDRQATSNGDALATYLATLYLVRLHSPACFSIVSSANACKGNRHGSFATFGPPVAKVRIFALCGSTSPTRVSIVPQRSPYPQGARSRRARYEPAEVDRNVVYSVPIPDRFRGTSYPSSSAVCATVGANLRRGEGRPSVNDPLNAARPYCGSVGAGRIVLSGSGNSPQTSLASMSVPL
jgi:hypothetical protein